MGLSRRRRPAGQSRCVRIVLTGVGDRGKNRASAGSTSVPGPPQEPRDTGAKRKCLYGVKDTMSFWVAKRGYQEDIVSFAGAMGWAAKQGPDPSFR